MPPPSPSEDERLPDSRKFPGGGFNDRRAFRLVVNKWGPCEFEDLVPGDVAVILEADGTPCKGADGCYTQYIVTQPFQDTDGVWVTRGVSCAHLASLIPPGA